MKLNNSREKSDLTSAQAMPDHLTEVRKGLPAEEKGERAEFETGIELDQWHQGSQTCSGRHF